MRLYRALLLLYPASFRAEYGGEMTSVFAARRREVSGWAGALAMWLEAGADVLRNAAAAHWELLRQDLRYTGRALARAPGFAVTALLVVALGVGANTAAFSVADFVLVRPLPYPHADRLVKVWQQVPSYPRLELSPSNFRDWKAASSSFTELGAYASVSFNLTGQGDPERLDGAQVTADLLPLLGVQPALGRFFTAEEDRAGVTGSAVLSWDLWQARFGGDRSVIGRRILLDGSPFNVVGVMPAGFHFPRREAMLWTAARFDDNAYADRTNTYLQALGRLRPDVSVEDARAEIQVIAARLAHDFPENEGVGGAVFTLREELSTQSRLLLLALCGAALCILLVACANLGNLLLARTIQRQRELALRTALGAGRERLVRQLVTESVVLAGLGGALGVLVALLAVPLLGRLVPSAFPTGGGPTLDLRALTIAALITGLTGLGFGVLPAMHAARETRLDSLRAGARTGGGRQRLRAVLVVTEVTATVVLLVSAGLLLRALWRLQAVDPGFRAEGVVALRTALPSPKYDSTAKRNRFYEQVLSEVRALPGVSGAAYVSFLPMDFPGGIWPVSLDATPVPRTKDQVASLRFVTPGFFRAMEIPLRRGRDVDARDRRDDPAVAVVSESFARRYWPGADPLGQRFQVAFAERTVVGVAADIRVRGVERESEPQVYLPATQVADSAIYWYAPKELVVRASGDQAALVTAVRRMVRQADPDQPVSNVRTLEEIVSGQTASRAVQARLLGLFAALALLLAGVGIHGLLSYSVSSRAQEIGVRMALGAAPRDVVSMVVGQGVRLAAAGVLPGLALAYAAGRTLESLLASVKPGDGVTFLVVAGVCLAMTTAGCLVPAIRAARLDPMAAIRAD